MNVEDSFFKDKRFIKLAIKLGDEDLALGCCIQMWFLAQNYWRKNQRIIPIEVWQKQDMRDELIEVGLAEKRDEGIYVKGAEKHFDWIYQRAEAGRAGGRVSAQRGRDDKGRLLPKQTPSKHQANPSAAKPHSHSHSLEDNTNTLPSEGVLQTQIELIPSPQKKRQTKEAPSGTNNAVGLYKTLWKDRWGKYPDTRPKEIGQIADLCRDLGVERAKQVITSYMAMPDPNFVRNRHDLGTMLLSLTRIAHYEATGKVVTSQVIKDAEEKINDAQGTSGGPRHISEILAERETQRNEQTKLSGG